MTPNNNGIGTLKDPKVKELWDKCKELGIEADIGKRWEQGIEHHPMAVRIFDMLEKSDWAFADDYFCWKRGGDGDNGETLMYALSVWIELVEAVAEELKI